MVSRQISVSRALELQVHVSWQEAVAIVGEVVVRRNESRPPGQPAPRIDPDACLLTPLGEVHLPFAAHGNRPDAEVELLRALLTGRPMPADLEAVAYGPPPASLGDALAMFSRPSRRADIAAVALRAISAEDDLERSRPATAPAPPPPIAVPSTAADDVAELRAQVGDRTAAKVAAPAPAASAGRRSRAAPAAAAAAIAVVVGMGQWMARRPPTPPAEPLAEEPLPAEPPPVVETLDLNDYAMRRDADIDLTRPRRPRAPAPEGAATQATTADAGGGPPGPANETDRPATLPATEGMAVRSSADPRESVTASAEPPVYSWRSVGVEPPEMVFPRMPASAFPAPGESIAGLYVEILVSEVGGVEAVRLRGTSTSSASAYRHSMMLAAAKAWQFKPARRDDVPVRYVTRVFMEP